VNRATSDDPAVQLDNDEIRHVLEQGDQLLAQQDALLDVALDELLDLAHVGRTGAADDGGHGIGGYEAVVYNAAHAGTDYWPYLRAVDETLRPFHPRVHWGKLHLLTGEQLLDRYPRAGDFIETRRRIDPSGVFLNGHLRTLFA